MKNLNECEILINHNEIVSSSTVTHSYGVFFTDDLYDKHCDLLLRYGKDTAEARRLVFIDNGLPSDIENKIYSYFQEKKVQCQCNRVQCDEETKDLAMLESVLATMESFGVERRGEPIICIGGGVLMDAVAMACSLYRRGVPFIKVPTTLLGIVDASIGIKTSVNHFGRRNRLGSYFFPKSVLVDPSHLCTLDENQISYGLAEVIKLAIIKDKSLFESMKEHSSYLLDAEFYRSGFGLEIIKQAMAGMIKELAPNPYETDLQRVVDFGHTFSPVPEMKSLVDSSVASLAHGQAVALDCLLTCAISHKRNLFKLDELVEVVNLMDNSGLASRHPYFNDVFMLWESLNDAVRHRDGSQNIPLPTTIGDSFFCNDLSIEELTAAVEFLDCWLRESGR